MKDTFKIFSNTILGNEINFLSFFLIFLISLGSLIGFPSISIPIGNTSDTNSPVGIEIMARNGDDKYEKEKKWTKNQEQEVRLKQDISRIIIITTN